MTIRQELEQLIRKAIQGLQEEGNLEGAQIDQIPLEHPEEGKYGDYATPIALQLAKQLGKRPFDIAELLVAKLSLIAWSPSANKKNKSWEPFRELEKIEPVVPGFVNFHISKSYLVSELARVWKEKEDFGQNVSLKGKKMMVEYAHPNTHKEMHIGHMRTLITGEALARIL